MIMLDYRGEVEEKWVGGVGVGGGFTNLGKVITKYVNAAKHKTTYF